MKKKLLLAVAIAFGATATYGQAYISLSGGYGFGTNQKVLGREVSMMGDISELKGSYGAGFQSQLRGGYFFTKRWGAELSVGYLHGEEVQVNKTPLMDMKARGRAYGASLSVVFNITDNIYVRAGGVTKIGGRTENITNLDDSGIIAGGYILKANFQTNFHGKIPFGFIGGLGYKFKVAEKVSLFIEGEYLAINVSRKTSKLGDFSATWGGNNLTLEQFKAMAGSDFQALLPLLEQEYDWSSQNPPAAPYSSIGVHLGLTYTF
ncbi:MAG: outer membrane beta-barrel protein [Capnocytophaga sp.]|nr:outer membrane beta-barrel protein [Capnocytophaga sp.]